VEERERNKKLKWFNHLAAGIFPPICIFGFSCFFFVLFAVKERKYIKRRDGPLQQFS